MCMGVAVGRHDRSVRSVLFSTLPRGTPEQVRGLAFSGRNPLGGQKSDLDGAKLASAAAAKSAAAVAGLNV